MKNILLITALAICQISLSQNGLYITTRGAIDSKNGIITVVNGHFENTSATGLNGGTLEMRSPDGNNYNLEITNSNTIRYLELYGSGTTNLIGELTLQSEILLNDTSKFNLTTGSHVTLLPTAEIVGESDINPISGANGTYIKITKNHSAGITNDFGLIGVEVRNSSSSMGSTEIFRRYGALSISGNPTAKRYYEVNPSNNTNLDLNVRFYLLNEDLNGLDRLNLAAFRSTDNGSTFNKEGGIPQTSYHEVSNLDAFSIWAFADGNTLSLETLDDMKPSISVYPNPANFNVNIMTNIDTEITSVALYNVLGRKINIDLSDDYKFSVNNLSDGTYFLKLFYQNGVIIKKLVVKK